MKKICKDYDEAAAWIARWKKGKRIAYFVDWNGRPSLISKTDEKPPVFAALDKGVPWSDRETVYQRMGLVPCSMEVERARKAGSVKSEAKARAAAANGREHGGRPRAGVATPRGERAIHKMVTLSREALELLARGAKADKAANGNASAYIERLIREDVEPWRYVK